MAAQAARSHHPQPAAQREAGAECRAADLSAAGFAGGSPCRWRQLPHRRRTADRGRSGPRHGASPPAHRRSARSGLCPRCAGSRRNPVAAAGGEARCAAHRTLPQDPSRSCRGWREYAVPGGGFPRLAQIGKRYAGLSRAADPAAGQARAAQRAIGREAFGARGRAALQPDLAADAAAGFRSRYPGTRWSAAARRIGDRRAAHLEPGAAGRPRHGGLRSGRGGGTRRLLLRQISDVEGSGRSHRGAEAQSCRPPSARNPA